MRLGEIDVVDEREPDDRDEDEAGTLEDREHDGERDRLAHADVHDHPAGDQDEDADARLVPANEVIDVAAEPDRDGRRSDHRDRDVHPPGHEPHVRSPRLARVRGAGARLGEHRRELREREASAGGQQRGDGERQPDGRPGLARGLANEHVDARAEDDADARQGCGDQPELTPQAGLRFPLVRGHTMTGGSGGGWGGMPGGSGLGAVSGLITGASASPCWGWSRTSRKNASRRSSTMRKIVPSG